MRVGIVTIAYNVVGSTERLLQSISGELWQDHCLTKHELCTYLFLHSTRFPEKVAECERLAKRYRTIQYLPYGQNRGISKSWNEGIWKAYGDGADLVLLVGEDILFHPGDFDQLIEGARQHPERWMVCAKGNSPRGRVPHGLSAGVYNRIAMETIGCFDENFFPAYWEDVDYDRRAERVGLECWAVEGTNVHHHGSACLQIDAALRSQLERTYPRNEQYYQRKWGSDACFATPFNDPGLNCYIPFESRASPYGKYDRTDRQELGYEQWLL